MLERQTKFIQSLREGHAEIVSLIFFLISTARFVREHASGAFSFLPLSPSAAIAADSFPSLDAISPSFPWRQRRRGKKGNLDIDASHSCPRRKEWDAPISQ